MRFGRPQRFCARSGVLACLALGYICVLRAQGEAPSSSDVSESRVKAAFVYNFAQFVEWPDETTSPGRPVLVGVLGSAQLTRVVAETLQGKSVRGRIFGVRQFSSSEGLVPCHILLVASAEPEVVQRVLQSLRGSPTLTIGDLEGFSDWGGVIEMFLEDNKFRFEINAEAARRGGLKLSSRLLRLARAVKSN